MIRMANEYTVMHKVYVYLYRYIKQKNVGQIILIEIRHGDKPHPIRPRTLNNPFRQSKPR